MPHSRCIESQLVCYQGLRGTSARVWRPVAAQFRIPCLSFVWLRSNFLFECASNVHISDASFSSCVGHARCCASSRSPRPGLCRSWYAWRIDVVQVTIFDDALVRLVLAFAGGTLRVTVGVDSVFTPSILLLNTFKDRVYRFAFTGGETLTTVKKTRPTGVATDFGFSASAVGMNYTANVSLCFTLRNHGAHLSSISTVAGYTEGDRLWTRLF
jgi:hypothetical protein